MAVELEQYFLNDLGKKETKEILKKSKIKKIKKNILELGGGEGDLTEVIYKLLENEQEINVIEIDPN